MVVGVIEIRTRKLESVVRQGESNGKGINGLSLNLGDREGQAS